MDMCTGKADPQKLYFGGKLKISGNVMASQKLDFLKKMDPQMVLDSMKERLGSSGAAAPAAAPAPEKTAPAQAEGGSADVFIAIRDHVEKHPELAAKIQTVFQFKLKSPESTYVLDLKNGKGSVSEGTVEKADCTLELSDADFIGMATGKLDAQKLFFGGQLKISGNVMASQKLMFLKEIDQEAAKKAVLAARQKGEAPKAAAPVAEAKGSATPSIIEALKARLAQNPALAKEVDAVIELRLTSPDAEWTLDMKAGEVRIGRSKGADAVLTLSDADFGAMVKGSEPAAHLFQTGRLRVDGDVRVAANKLGFLKGLV
ncbi:MAG: SCP2 sterol-binding domain-containing protein [Polyangiaceae bacterium]|nr:SCP2 sterol-binding domain-containing protein [Polyangiaceae bacterium]